MSAHRVRNGTQGTMKLTLLTLDVWDLALWPPSGPPGPLLLFTGVSAAWSPESLGWLMRTMQVEFNLILF